MGILIKNGELVSGKGRRVADLLCRDGRIAAVGESIEPSAGDEVLDASGQYVFPGGVDPHVHMSLPVAGTVSSDDFESGTAAGLAGGTTTIIDFVHPERGQDYVEALRDRRREAAGALADHGFHMAVTWWGDGTAAAMRRCVEEEGVPSFKTYLAYKAAVGIDDGDLIQAMQTAADLGGLILVHAEHGEMVEHLRDRLATAGKTAPRYHALSRPAELEGEATHRAATLAGATGAELYVVHVTCRESVDAIRRAQQRGVRIHAETCPQYLLLDDTVYDKPDFEGAAYVIAPPIRPRGHQEVLWKALQEGVVTTVGTDHCPFHLAGQKELGRGDFRKIPGGAPGIEHRLALLYTFGVLAGRLDLESFVDLVSTRPAKRFGLWPRKGCLAVGADADLVVWDPAASGTISAATHRHNCDRSIYEGFETRGAPSTVVASGSIAFRDGDLRLDPGAGRFLARHL